MKILFIELTQFLPKQVMTDERHYWQPIWRNICEMAYFRKNIKEEIVIPSRKIVYSKFFEECKLDHQFFRISSIINSDGTYIEPQVVPELVYLKVPKVLFEHVGINAWFRYSFPNCKVELW